ncbi:MAG: hypothetical protein H8E27_08365 [Verrucomicrobia subdivision 3 bacterium]|nr:hypothetical protein [Limisphaerales bacterium]
MILKICAQLITLLASGIFTIYAEDQLFTKEQHKQCSHFKANFLQAFPELAKPNGAFDFGSLAEKTHFDTAKQLESFDVAFPVLTHLYTIEILKKQKKLLPLSKKFPIAVSGGFEGGRYNANRLLRPQYLVCTNDLVKIKTIKKREVFGEVLKRVGKPDFIGRSYSEINHTRTGEVLSLELNSAGSLESIDDLGKVKSSVAVWVLTVDGKKRATIANLKMNEPGWINIKFISLAQLSGDEEALCFISVDANGKVIDEVTYRNSVIDIVRTPK